jgi:hypothetical protein
MSASEGASEKAAQRQKHVVVKKWRENSAMNVRAAVLFVLLVAACAVGAVGQDVPPNTWVRCPPANASLMEGATEFFSDTSFVLEHLTMTVPPSLSKDPSILAKSRANYEKLLKSRECAWFRVPLTYLNNGVKNVADSSCTDQLCYLNITVYRFLWKDRKDFLTQSGSFNPPSAYPFGPDDAQRRPVDGQMMLIEDGPGRDATDMQSMLIDQFGLVYEPLDFYIPNMRGCASAMDFSRSVSGVPSQTSVSCSSSVSKRPRPDWAPDHLMPCIQEANLKYGRWMAGMSTRHYANDLLSVLDSNPPTLPATRRLVYGRGYGATVADEMQTILNCNSARLKQSLKCSWWSRGSSSCGSSFFIPNTVGFQVDAFVFDGAHDFEKTDAKQLFQGVNLVGHLALQGCPGSTCRSLFGKEGYQATLDAFYLMNNGWCPEALETRGNVTGFSRDHLISLASLFSAMGYSPKSSVMASGSLPALIAVVFRYIRCLPQDVEFLNSVASAQFYFDGEFEVFSRVNFLVLLNVFAHDFYSDALGNAVNFDSQVIAANALSPFKSFFSDFLPNLLGMWPVPRDSFCSNIVQNTGTIACYNQPVLFMHGSLDSETIPQGFVDNTGTVSAVNPNTVSVYQDNVGHTIFYTASSSVWSFLQQNVASNFTGIRSLLPLPSAIAIDWQGGVESKFPSNNFWCPTLPTGGTCLSCYQYLTYS